MWINVHVDDWTAEWAIIASNVNSVRVDAYGQQQGIIYDTSGFWAYSECLINVK